jgi:hypothetical protein
MMVAWLTVTVVASLSALAAIAARVQSPRAGAPRRGRSRGGGDAMRGMPRASQQCGERRSRRR